MDFSRYNNSNNDPWMRNTMERRIVSVRFGPSFKIISEKGVAQFYEVVKRREKIDLPPYDDFLFGIGVAKSNDVRFIFDSVVSAYRFKSLIYNANFDHIGVESIKWIDVAASRSSPVNENFKIITSQLGDGSKLDQKEQSRKGGLYRVEGDGFGQILSHMNDGTRTPLDSPTTPVKPWNGGVKEEVEEIPSLPKKLCPTQQEGNGAASGVTAVLPLPSSAFPPLATIPAAAPPAPTTTSTLAANANNEEELTVEKVKARISALSKHVVDGATAGRPKEDMVETMAELHQWNSIMQLSDYHDGDIKKACRMYCSTI